MVNITGWMDFNYIVTRSYTSVWITSRSENIQGNLVVFVYNTFLGRVRKEPLQSIMGR